MVASNRDLRRRGYPQADIDLAERQREAEKRAGGRVRSLAEVLAGKPARARPDAAPENLTARQLRARGRYGQAALLVDQEALAEHDSARATEARNASGILKRLATAPAQLEFNFFMANVSIGFEYYDAIRDRLITAQATPAERSAARSLLLEIIRWGGWNGSPCEKTAAELAALLDVNPGNLARSLTLLESVGAIDRVKRGRTKIITVTPEGAYRGDITRHAEAVDRYRAEIVPLRRALSAPPLAQPDGPEAA